MPTVRRNSWCGLAVAFAMQAARFRNIQLRGISTNAWMHSSPPIYMCVWVRQLDLFYRMDRCDTLETLSHVRAFTVQLQTTRQKSHHDYPKRIAKTYGVKRLRLVDLFYYHVFCRVL